MKRIDAILMLCAALIGILAAYSSNRWMAEFDRAPAVAKKAKEDLLACGDLWKLHHRICKKVGEHAWETRVKPKFMSAITYATIRETGNILPETSDIIQWVRAHPEESHRLLQEAAEAKDSFWQ